MITKLFGILDILTALAFFLNNNFDRTGSWFPNSLVLILAIYLIIKGIIFVIILDFASLIDIICAIIILISLVTPINAVLTFLVVIFLFQKGIFSVVS